MRHGKSAQPTRQNRTITVDFQESSTYLQLMNDGKACVECGFALLLSLGLQLTHQATCTGGGCLTRHSHDARGRLVVSPSGASRAPPARRCAPLCRTASGAIARCGRTWPAMPSRPTPRWPPCGAVRRARPHLTPGALSWDLRLWTPPLGHGANPGGVPLPTYILADEQHRRCLTERVYLPTPSGACPLASGGQGVPKRGGLHGALWRVARAALAHAPSYQGRAP